MLGPSPTLAHRVAARYRLATVIPDRWFREQKAKLAAILKEPLQDGPDVWPWIVTSKVLPFFKQFETAFLDMVSQAQARTSIENRVQGVGEALETVVRHLNMVVIPARDVDFDDPASFLKWYAYTDIHEKMREQAKRTGDLLRWRWGVAQPQVDTLVKRTLRAASPDERAALTGNDTRGAKYTFLARVGFSSAAKRLLKRSKTSLDFNTWVDHIQEMLQANYAEQALQQEDTLSEFEVSGVKVIVDDSTVTGKDVKKYVGYLQEAYVRLRQKGLASAWYGNVFIRCKDCGGINQNTGGGVGGWYETAKDTVTLFSRPSSFVVELMVHELGHRFWFKSMTSAQRARFTDLVKTRTVARPEVPAGVKVYGEDDLHALKQIVEVAQREGERAIGRARKYTWSNATSAAKHNVSKDLWSASQDILRAVDRLEVDKGIGTEAKGLKDDAYKAESALVERAGDVTLIDESQLEEWLVDVQQRLDMLAANALIYIDFAAQRHNEAVKESMGPAFREWAESYDRNPNPVPAVSNYGKSNVDEAFAEVFAHYVMEYDITRDQVDSFKSVLKTASEPTEETTCSN